MFATTASAARAYAQVGTQSGVDSADPHRLVLMLFDGALESIARARSHLAAGRIGPRGESVSRAIQIVEQGLKASLDPAAGGPLAGTLADLYDYIGRLLLNANVHASDAALAEGARLLGELRGAWATIGSTR